MKKYLKKVISAVAALALSVSSFAAMAAVSYPDTVDHQHESAINMLSALGIVEGFEDGTFHPDELVTRAQMAAMVLRAKNNFNAENNKTQVFNDVPADNWAAGWIATAASQGIVNGTGNNNFDPDLNVTYEQTVKMLVSMLNYGDWAEMSGGWPTGYLNYGNQLGITSGVSGVSNDTALTRAQCAQMIANALDAAILFPDGYEIDNGQYYPRYIQKDGSTSDNGPFTSILVDNWDIYVVNGMVTETSRSGNFRSDQVRYEVQQSKNYKGVSYGLKSVYPQAGDGVTADVTVLKGDTDADNYLNIYTKALIKSDDYNDDELIYIESSDRNDVVTFASDLYSAIDTSGKDYDTLQVRRSATTSQTTSYRMDKNWKLIVNGVNLNPTPANLKAYVENNPGMTVTVTDYPAVGSSTPDNRYDAISVDYYVVAVVSEVVDEEDATRIYFDDSYPQGLSELEVQKDDDEYSYTFTKDGVAVNPTDLVENDVLSIVCDLSDIPDEDATVSDVMQETFENSSFYEVTVSQATAEGMVTAQSTNSNDQTVYTIGGTDYVLVDPDNTRLLTTGDEYIVYLTADGRVAGADKLASAVNYAIVDTVFKRNGDESAVRIIDKTGVKTTYTIADTTLEGDNIVADMWEDYLPDSDVDNQYPLADRIIDYSLNSSNQLRVKTSNNIRVVESDAADYNANTSRLGSYRINDVTVVIDVSSAWDDTNKKFNSGANVSLASVASFADGQSYGFVGARDSAASASDPLPFLVVKSGLGGFTVDTQLAVVQSTYSTTDDGQPRTGLNLLLNGEETQVLCSDDSSTYSNLTEGTPILFKYDSEGYIDVVYKLLNLDINNSDKYAFFKTLVNGSIENGDFLSDAVKTDSDLKSIMGDDDDHVQFVLAPVYDRQGESVNVFTDVKYDTFSDSFVQGATDEDNSVVSDADNKAAYYVEEGAIDAYSFDSDVAVYTYNGTRGAKFRTGVGTSSSIIKSNILSSGTGKLDTAGTFINLGLQDEARSSNRIHFVLMRVYDGTAQEVYFIQMSNENGQDAVFSPYSAPATGDDDEEETATTEAVEEEVVEEEVAEDTTVDTAEEVVEEVVEEVTEAPAE